MVVTDYWRAKPLVFFSTTGLRAAPVQADLSQLSRWIVSDEWFGPTSGVLEFATIVNGIKINGVDIITWNADNRITHFKVMVRPLKAVNMLHQMMAGQLAALAP